MIEFKEMDDKRIAYDGIVREYFEPQTYAKFVRAEKNPDGSGKIGSCYNSIEGQMIDAIVIPTLEDFDVFIDAFNAICEQGKDLFKDEEYYSIKTSEDDWSINMWKDRFYKEKDNYFYLSAVPDCGFGFTDNDAPALRDILKDLKAIEIPETSERSKLSHYFEDLFRKLVPQST